MTPYFQGTLATIYLGDAAEVLPTLETESFDLVVTDPPYGQEWRSNLRVQRFDHMAGDGATDREGVRSVLAECVRLTDQNKHLYVFGPDDVLGDLKVTKPVSLIWDKGVIGSGDLASCWGPQHEPIWFLVSKHRHAGQAGGESLAARRRKGSVLRVPRQTGRKVRHPSEKPVALLRELVESSSRVGELVLDPFGGIGSTAVAATLLGRRSVSVEIAQEYADLAVTRIKQAECLYAQMEVA